MWLDDLKKAKENKSILANSTTEERNNALLSISKALLDNIDSILVENKKDLDNATNLPLVMQKRLLLTEQKIKDISSDILSVISLEDPVNQVLEEIKRPNGLLIKKVKVPLGIIGIIYESRPNVSVDIASLCIKTGNICVLKGGKEAINTNRILTNIMKNAIKKYIPSDSIIFIDDITRESTNLLITLKDLVDLIIPRGSANLINYVTSNSLVPVIETGAGICHIYVDKEADIDMAINIVYNAKTSNPAVCNAVETILVHKDVAKLFFPRLEQKFKDIVVMNGCEETKKYIDCNLTTEENYKTEYDDLIISIKVVNSLEEAINHISKYSTKHSETIVTNNIETANIFLSTIDSACLYHNASTRFTDGSCFGFGSEIGISTQKLHARGPMGLKEMMTYKYKIYGSGQIRE